MNPMRRLRPLALLVLASCTSFTTLPKETRARLSARYLGRTVELKHSCYYGDLYEENERWMLSPYPFADTTHIVDLDGNPIHPQKQHGLIPAGARFEVRKIEFPDIVALSQRMLTTPRYNPWVYLRAHTDNTPPLPDAHTYVLVLPPDLKTEEAVEQALSVHFGTPGSVRTWLAERRPSVRAAILHKDVVRGMSPQEMVAALGVPHQWFVEKRGTGDERTDVAWYTSQEIWLRNNRVVDVRPGRASAPPPAPNASGDR